MILPSDIRDYLAARGITAAIVDGFQEVDLPDRIIYVTPTGGPGETRERTFDQINVQVMARGARGDLEDAMGLAQEVDDAFMRAVYPVQIDGRHVPRIQRTGGPPAPIHRDDARRSITSCNYIVEIAR